MKVVQRKRPYSHEENIGPDVEKVNTELGLIVEECS